MKVLMYVLNDANLLSDLLEEFKSVGIRGCTILESNGMGRELGLKDDFTPIVGSLRMVLEPSLSKTKTLMLVLEESKVETVVGAIEKVVGDLDKPGTGIVFSYSLDYVKGLKL